MKFFSLEHFQRRVAEIKRYKNKRAFRLQRRGMGSHKPVDYRSPRIRRSFSRSALRRPICLLDIVHFRGNLYRRMVT